MSGQIAPHAVRLAIAEALATVMTEVSHAQLSRETGVPRPSVYRKGDDVHAWHADDFMAIADHHPELADAIVARYRGADHRRPEAVLAIPEIMQAIQLAGCWTSTAAKALEDGKIDAQEAKELTALLRERIRTAEILITDLESLWRSMMNKHSMFGYRLKTLIDKAGYSLREFARIAERERSEDAASSHLSMVINGKRPAVFERAERWADALQLEGEERKGFLEDAICSQVSPEGMALITKLKREITQLKNGRSDDLKLLQDTLKQQRRISQDISRLRNQMPRIVDGLHDIDERIQAAQQQRDEHKARSQAALERANKIKNQISELKALMGK